MQSADGRSGVHLRIADPGSLLQGVDGRIGRTRGVARDASHRAQVWGKQAMYRTLAPDKILSTLDRLADRVGDRFPASGLRSVCQELAAVGRETQARTERIQRPNVVLRSVTLALATGGAVLLAYVASIIEVKRDAENLFGVLQGIDAAVNILIVMGAAAFFLSSLEARWKRQQALAHLHELRSIVHVIDMHQLTKDPAALIADGPETRSSPKRTLTPFELARYLDYCSELLSLAAKIAALYAQASRDGQVQAAVTDIERLSANLSQKVWQKIMIIGERRDRGDEAAPASRREQAGPAADGVPATSAKSS